MTHSFLIIQPTLCGQTGSFQDIFEGPSLCETELKFVKQNLVYHMTQQEDDLPSLHMVKCR